MDSLPERARCPDCGTELVSEGGVAGLCPQCLLSLALKDSPPGSEGDATVDEIRSDSLVPLGRLAAGRVLGERYQIREFLGRGGMGEVFRAFDLKLRVDVALKAVRPGRLEDARARDRLRREVRAAREVVSPNVCRIFDLVDEDGQELVSMEYVDGGTLAETLRRRGPLELKEAREVASQLLAGLEAIHRAGLVHRDFKPENVMLTRAGRVVVMDFGLAKLASTELAGTAAGTPAYMAPEQMRGQPVDARADVFAAGVVLAEMVSAGGPDPLEARRELWRGVRETPPRVPEGPWAAVLRQCLSPSPAERPASARALARALEELTERLPGVETTRPYPGLASFTETDKEFFHGREAEIEAVSRKLKRPRMVALVGPSGAGKSSFLRAGILPALPSSWATLVTTPGTRPLQALAQALAPHLASDPQAVRDLVRFEDADASVGLVSRWRRRHEHAVIAVDQFEELFTQNPPPVQATFAGLLGRLVLEADAHVVLSLRDDFLIHCHAHEALAPILSELTLVGPLSESGLRRALVQPALSCGYRFEDEALVEEMLAAVRGERGALPLLAFAASRLWALRDPERGLLTWEAYRQIGGVAGALAQHAEATLERIGSPRTPLVRELFRNLVTAEGTRALQERSELLSVFGEAGRGAAGEVLDALVSARLLTQYERTGEDAGGGQIVEIVHESLLNAWPRLVRWRTQDADGAQLRDQLRQAARLWDERGRAEDLLWTGSAYRDLALWRERYSGGLTATEQDFAHAAGRLSGRRRRRRRIAATAAILTAATVALTTTVLWHRSEAARRHAEAQAQRREAAELLALGRLRLEDHPSATLAYAIASLERVDNTPARLLALEALWQGPTEFVLAVEGAAPTIRFSGDGRFLAYGTIQGARLQGHDGGSARPLASDQPFPLVAFSGDSRFAVTRAQAGGVARVFSVPGAEDVRDLPLGTHQPWVVRADRIVTLGDRADPGPRRTVLAWPLDGGSPRPLGAWDARGVTSAVVSPDGSRIAAARDGRLVLQSLQPGATSPSGADRDVRSVWANAHGPMLSTLHQDGRLVRVWSAAGGQPELIRELRSAAADTIENLVLDPTGRYVSARAKSDRLMHRLWDLHGPPDLEPITLRDRDAEGWIMGRDFDPDGRWLAVAHNKYASLWSLNEKLPRVIRGLAPPFFTTVAFSPDGRFLVSGSYGGEVWRYSLDRRGSSRLRLYFEANRWLGWFPPAFSPRGDVVVVSTQNAGRLLVIPIDGGAAEAIAVGQGVGRIAWRRDGRVLAAVVSSPTGDSAVSLRALPGGETRRLTTTVPGESCVTRGGHMDAGYVFDLAFLPDGRLLTLGLSGLRIFEAGADSGSLLRPCQPRQNPDDSAVLRVTTDGSRAVVAHTSLDTSRTSELVVIDLASGREQAVVTHGVHVTTLATDASDRFLVTGSAGGLVRVGPLAGASEPHLLYGHSALVTGLAISPDGQWIASAAEDGTIRLWPMPEGAPLHTLPYEELLAKLCSLTNLRVVPDAGSATGYKVQPGPFPGWAVVPTW